VGQRLVVKYGAVFCRMDSEAVCIPQASNSRYRGRNGIVSKTGRMGEDQDLIRIIKGRQRSG
jgi:hypothetical protein